VIHELFNKTIQKLSAKLSKGGALSERFQLNAFTLGLD